MNNSQEPLIQLENVSKSYGKFKALDGLSLSINPGEIFGLIGPNGSGKTTAITILVGIQPADNGSKIKISKFSIPSELKAVYPLVGYMPQDLSLYMDLTIQQNLEFFAELQQISWKIRNQNIKDVLNLVELTEFRDRVLSKCSGGMQRRCSLAIALLHKPKILILDEPTVGIDPELRNIFWDHFRKLAQQGTTILITTHYLAESARCNRVAFINKNIKAIGSPAALQETVQNALHLPSPPDMEEVFIYYTKQANNLTPKEGN